MMAMSKFLKALRSGRVLLMDGAMGTQLQRAGLKPDQNPAAWNLRYPQRVSKVHRAYRASGAEVFLTNTFLGFATSLDETLQAAGRLGGIYARGLWTRSTKLIAPPEEEVFRLISIGPVAGRVAEREFDQWDHFRAKWLTSLSADAILLETCSSPRAHYAIQKFREHSCPQPLLLSLTFRHDDSGALVTASGHSPEWFARRAEKFGIAALGVNCGRDISMDDIIEIIRRYRQVTDLPLFARPNAGTPRRVGKRWVYPHTPQQMAAKLPELLAAGVSMVGGCCGTTPEHIAAFRPIVKAWNRQA
jgi:5-methyltetrahydrofolate--homocysteine methyltransferase